VVICNTWLSAGGAPETPKSLERVLDVFQGGIGVEQQPGCSRVGSWEWSSRQVAQHSCTNRCSGHPALYLHRLARALGQQGSKVLEFIRLH